MANHILDPEYIKRLADLIRRWCRDESMPYLDQNWMIDQMIAWLWRDSTCARRLRASAYSQGVENPDQIAKTYLGFVLARGPNVLAQLLYDVLESDDANLVVTCRPSVLLRVRNLLYHDWSKSDSIGASINKALWHELDNHPDLYILLPNSAPTPRFVTMVRDGQIRTDRPIITYGESLRLISEIWKGSRQIPGCVRGVLEVIRDDGQWCALMPINDVLFGALCESARQGILRAEELKFTPSEVSPDVARVLKSSLVPTMQRVREMLQKYVEDGRVSRPIADGLYKAVGNIYEDFGLSGDRNADHADYVMKCCPRMSKEDFRTSIRNKFQYIMREANVTLDREFRKRWGVDSANPENHD